MRRVLSTAVVALRTNLGRSLLTVLGIVIGVMAVVLVVALGQAAQRLILSEVEGIGANSLIVIPGRQPEGPTDIAATILSDSLKWRDVLALRRPENVPDVELVEPAVLVPGSVNYQDNVFHPVIFGWSGEALERMFQIFPEQGAYFGPDDVISRSKVAVLGHRVAEELFGDGPAVGEAITVQRQKMRVVGVLPKRGQVSSFNLDEVVLIPYSTAQRDLLAIDHFHRIFIQTTPGADVTVVGDDIRQTLRDLHGIIDPAKDDFFVLTQEDIVERIGTVTSVLTIFLSAIASISLLVGGVGIMNIMMVSVTERTSEIGLRKAVGATTRDILWQFLAEAMLLTVSGGLAGTILAVVLASLAAVVIRERFALNWPLVLPAGAMALGVAMAAVVGLVFGLYPALRAARKDPVEALRYE